MLFRKKKFVHETRIEEAFNASSHGIALLLGISALVIMVVFSALEGSTMRVVTSSIYGATMVLMFTVSTLYHAFAQVKIKRFFKMLDHISIYLLIAGTYTPVMLVSIGGGWGWSMFGVIWGLALVGVVFKILFTGRFEVFSLSLYGFMGWLVLVAIVPLMQHLPFVAIMWFLVGGLCYTLGIIFYVLDAKYHFSHFFWHLFVLAGCSCHFFATLFYVVLLR